LANKVCICGIDTSSLPKSTNKELVRVMEEIKAGTEGAREEFIMLNMRLVLSIVQRFSVKEYNSDDVFQVGIIGLMKAIDNFDTTLNVKFSTYAVPMILGEIRRHLRDNNSIRVSRSIRDTAYKVLKAREELSKTLVRDPNSQDIAEYLDIPIRAVAVAMEAISDPVSLCESVYDDGEDSIYLMDQLSDDNSSDEKWLENISLKDSLDRLDPRQREILLLRYYHGRTQVEVSNDIGISQAQVSRLEKTAIDSIRNTFC